MLICGKDYGDAPDSYGTTNASNGATHTIVSGIHLGTPPDAEADAATPLDGSGDGAEDDGVELNGAILQGETLTTGSTVNLDIATAGAGKLNAWIDWNQDGDFTDANEQIATDVAPTSNAISLPVNVPAGATVGNYLRSFPL